MKNIYLLIVSVLFLAAFNNPVHKNSFKDLFALEGMWLMQTKKGFVGEEWKKLNKDQINGRGIFIRGSDTTTSENIKLVKQADGIFYIPVVEDQNNKQPVIFKMTGNSNKMFVFENPGHDFPKRVVYKFISADSLHAFVDDGTETGKRLDFYYKRHQK